MNRGSRIAAGIGLINSQISSADQKPELPVDIADNLPTGQPSYFFLAANADGSVQSVRELDTEDQAARKVSPPLRVIKLPAIQVDASPLASVYIVKLVRGSDGKLDEHAAASQAVNDTSRPLSSNSIGNSAASNPGHDAFTCRVFRALHRPPWDHYRAGRACSRGR